MEWLEAALAFAVIMIVLSIAVSVMTETLHRILRLREDGLSRMVTALYLQVVYPRLADRLKDGESAVDDFVTTVTSTRYRPWSDKRTRWPWLTWLLNGFARLVPGTVNAEKLKSLSTLEFVERFAETSAGRALIEVAEQRGTDFKKDFLKDLVSKYEDFGENSRDYFARRARLTSVIVSFVLAFALSINVIDLFQILLTDKGVRDTWIDKGEQAAAQWQRQAEELQALLVEKGSANQLSPEKASALIKANIQELEKATASLQEAGLPIGWERRPWAGGEWHSIDCGRGDAWSSKGCLDRAGLLVQWVLAVLFSGLLIGLGGPFWFEIYRKLGSLVGITRGVQSVTQQAKEPGKRLPSGAESGQTTDSTVMEVFDIASKGQAMALLAGRLPPGTDGGLEKGDR